MNSFDLSEPIVSAERYVIAIFFAWRASLIGRMMKEYNRIHREELVQPNANPDKHCSDLNREIANNAIYYQSFSEYERKKQ